MTTTAEPVVKFPFLFGRAFIEATFTVGWVAGVPISLPFRKGFH